MDKELVVESKLHLSLVSSSLIEQLMFIANAQNAFQYAYEKAFGKRKRNALSRNYLLDCFTSPNTFVYFAKEENRYVGGAIVTISKTQNNELDLLFVNSDYQNKGLGRKIWQEVEKLYPNTRSWELQTPYNDVRNIHFYINQLGFKVIELLHANSYPIQNSTDLVLNFPKYRDVYALRLRKELC